MEGYSRNLIACGGNEAINKLISNKAGINLGGGDLNMGEGHVHQLFLN